LPSDSDLHAELLVPTRAIGFVHPGQSVQLRYEAFPYERFGQYQGTVESVGSSAWITGEKLGPLTLSEPVYRIIVKLERQTVAANGQSLALRPGMLVGADLLMERRSLLEWLFQPLLQLKMRMQ
jgi:membrane fusion protein